MQRIGQSLLTNLRGSGDAPLETTGGAPLGGKAPSLDPARRLADLCLGPHAPALLRPLAPTCALICQLLHGHATPAAAAPGLASLVSFLQPGSDREERLELALRVHTDVASSRARFCDMEAVVTQMAQVKALKCKPALVKAALAQWRLDWEAFVELCRDVWELHTYFVFLDVKGDRALLELAALRLCGLLECSAQGLTAALARSGPWVDDAFGMLSERQNAELFQQCHVHALQQWRVAWQDRVRRLPRDDLRVSACGQPGELRSFWELHFQYVTRVPWVDFLEVFEDFCLLGPCPTDLAVQLRKKLDTKKVHQVSEASWRKLIDADGCSSGIVDSLLGEVLGDVTSHIYRKVPLPTLAVPAATDLAPPPSGEKDSAGGAPSAGGAGRASRAKSRHSSGPADGRPGGEGAGAADKGGPRSDTIEEMRRLAVAPTPPDLTRTQKPNSAGERVKWQDYCQEMRRQHCPWWGACHGSDARRVLAIGAVANGAAHTMKALLLRVVGGSLADGKPVLEMPASEKASKKAGSSKVESLPTVVVTASGSRTSGVTMFGRDSSKRVHRPDFPMSEPIASRSHFSVVYDQEQDRYSIMDAGSKWGTFVKVTDDVALKCGDWIRVGAAEFVIRYCGGGCSCHSKHRHSALRSLMTFKEHRPSTDQGPANLAGLPDALGEKEAEQLLEDALQMMLDGVHSKAWRGAGASACRSGPMGCESQNASCTAQDATRSPACGAPSAIPVPPLEIDFISGPRMGERLVLTDRTCTLGRSDAATIQVTDPDLANISRVHCIFEYKGNRWHIRDNGSTNGTWRRLSCMLEPSRPVPLTTGMSLLAGIHELVVEEAETPCWWQPSTASATLEGLQRREVEARASAAFSTAAPLAGPPAAALAPTAVAAV